MGNLKLGVTAKDKVTGFQGIIVGKCEYLTGCTQYGVQPQSKDGSKIEESRWLDEGRLEVVEGGASFTKEELKGDENGADFDAPSMNQTSHR